MHFRCHNHADDSDKFGFIVLAYNYHYKNEQNRYLYYFQYNENNESTPIQRIIKINFTCPFQKGFICFIGSINGLICIVRGPSICILVTPSLENMIYFMKLREIIVCTMIFGPRAGYVSSSNEYNAVGIYVSKGNTHVEVHIYTL